VEDAVRIQLWTCDICKKRWVVPDLARMCEDKHLEEEYK